MATSPEYAEYIVDLLTPHYPVTTRKMFGGVGIFCEFGMCALITSEDVVHFKVDDENRADYEAAGMTQFHRMPYFQLPEELFENADELDVWLANSIAAAQRAQKKKKK